MEWSLCSNCSTKSNRTSCPNGYYVQYLRIYPTSIWFLCHFITNGFTLHPAQFKQEHQVYTWTLFLKTLTLVLTAHVHAGCILIWGVKVQITANTGGSHWVDINFWSITREKKTFFKSLIPVESALQLGKNSSYLIKMHSFFITSFRSRCVWLDHSNSLVWWEQAEFCPFSKSGLTYSLWSLYWLPPEIYSVVIYVRY